MQFDPQNDLAFVVVIYNRQCSDSETLTSFRGQSGLRALVVDNSDSREIKAINVDYCQEMGYTHLDMGGNQGLSKAYNQALSLLDDHIKYVVLFDDDTTLPSPYFDTLFQALSQKLDADILLPKVMSTGRLISPCIRRGSLFFKARSGKLSQVVSSRRVSAINSGMVICLKRIPKDSKPFDETLFLDCIDHDFMYNQNIVQHRIVELYEVILDQRFSDRITNRMPEEKTIKCRRFEIFARDYLIFCRKNQLGFFIPRLYLAYRAVKLSVRHRSFRFLTVPFGVKSKAPMKMETD